MRLVNGSASFEVFGWHATHKTAAFLVPMTFINLTTLAILVIAMRTGKRERSRFDPTDPVSVILSYDETAEHLQSMTLGGRDIPTLAKT
jgi:hypothetical protein